MFSAIVFAVVTFACTLGAAMATMSLRRAIPTEHLTKESQDVIRLGMGLVATMTALLLGLVTAAAKGSFDSQDLAVRNAAAGLVTLDRLLARYGPETEPTRDLLKTTVGAWVDAVWPSGSARGNGAGFTPASKPNPAAEEIENQVLRLTPSTDVQRWLRTESLKLTEEVLRIRWRLMGSASGAVPRAFIAVVIFWLSMTFASFGLSAPRNATVTTVFVIAALSVAAAVFLIFELDGAFQGAIKISGDPFRVALSNLGQ